MIIEPGPGDLFEEIEDRGRHARQDVEDRSCGCRFHLFHPLSVVPLMTKSVAVPLGLQDDLHCRFFYYWNSLLG
jgi:hypothetical protein